MHTIIWRDLRLEGHRPNGGKEIKVMECGKDTPLSTFTTYSKAYSDTVKKDKSDTLRLKIMAHGYYVQGSGGFGVQFCKEGLNVETLENLKPLRGKFKGGVIIYACGAAVVTPGSGVGLGNGAIFCRRLAMTLDTSVSAADAVQLYNKGSAATDKGMFFGQWQGNLYTWDNKGKLIKKQKEPNDF